MTLPAGLSGWLKEQEGPKREDAPTLGKTDSVNFPKDAWARVRPPPYFLRKKKRCNRINTSNSPPTTMRIHQELRRPSNKMAA
jgi:hypothetical protein